MLESNKKSLNDNNLIEIKQGFFLENENRPININIRPPAQENVNHQSSNKLSLQKDQYEIETIQNFTIEIPNRVQSLQMNANQNEIDLNDALKAPHKIIQSQEDKKSHNSVSDQPSSNKLSPNKEKQRVSSNNLPNQDLSNHPLFLKEKQKLQ